MKFRIKKVAGHWKVYNIKTSEHICLCDKKRNAEKVASALEYTDVAVLDSGSLTTGCKHEPPMPCENVVGLCDECEDSTELVAKDRGEL